MAEVLIARIGWGKQRHYLYGSTIAFSDDGVFFENLYFASGKPIKKWQSRTSYQGDRFSPELPLLVPGADYRMAVEVETIPANRSYIQLDFFNRQNEKIAYKILRETDNLFTCPEETFTYTMTLYSAGCQQLTYKTIGLYRLQEGADRREGSKLKPNPKELPEELELVAPLL